MIPRRLTAALAAALVIVLTLTACDRADDATLYGYAEGRFRLLAPESTGRIAAVMVVDGDSVAASAALARLDDALERAALDEARAKADAADSRLADASAGGRRPEIEAAREQVVQAKATAADAAAERKRVEELFARGWVPRSRVDTAEATARAAEAHVAEMLERLALIELPAREHAIQALRSDADAAHAAVDSAGEALARRTLYAPSAGRIERVLREPGEMAGPDTPIIRFLPDGAMQAIGFAPESRFGGMAIGDRFAVACDACPDGLTAVVTRIAHEAEYTAPTIFSDQERERLVFRFEARFEGAAPPASPPAAPPASPPSGTPLRLKALP